MKCQMCNGEGGKIPHPENYGSYREDCPTCNGTGKQPPVDRLLRFEEYMEKTQGTSADNVYWEAHAYVATLEAELSAARGEIEKKTESIKMLVLDAKRLEDENERLKKAELRASKGVVYLSGLLSVKTKEKLSVDWIQEALNLED